MSSDSPTPLIVLAAGRSTRFGALKQVAPLGPEGGSILVYTIVDALRAGFDEVVLVVRAEIEGEILEHIEGQLGPGLPIRTVHQDAPLGTAHAALAALDGISGAAGLANGDDFYGLDALGALRSACARIATAPVPPAHAGLVGYRMEGTLSEHGGVSRGAIETEANGVVISIREILDVRLASDASPGDADQRLVGRTMLGDTVALPLDTPASMNLWALGPGLGPLLHGEFTRWSDGDEREEFALTDVLESLRADEQVEIRLEAEADGWFGVTFPDDADDVRDRLSDLYLEGIYHGPLSAMMDDYRCS